MRLSRGKQKYCVMYKGSKSIRQKVAPQCCPDDGVYWHRCVLGICVSTEQFWSWSTKTIRTNSVWHKETSLAQNLATIAFISKEMEQSFSLIMHSLQLHPSSQFQTDIRWVSPTLMIVFLLGPVLTTLIRAPPKSLITSISFRPSKWLHYTV